MSHCFDLLRTADGGMHVVLKGKEKNQKAKTLKQFIVAKNVDGPQILKIPAIILAKRIIAGEIFPSGSMPCVGMVSLEDCLKELAEFEVSQQVG